MARTLTGEELGRRIAAIGRNLPAMSEDALRGLGQRVFDKSQILVPVDKGKLQRSGRWEIAREAGAVTLRIIYGEPDAPYAIVVHEDLQAQHDNGQAKFLEQPLLEEIATALQTLADEIDLQKLVA